MDTHYKTQIETVLSENKVFVFMKGSPEMPQCGFSAQVVHVLKKLDVEFGHFNVLSDDGMRQAIKEYSNWPTLPQVFINKEFIGGCDITMQLFESGELQKKLDA